MAGRQKGRTGQEAAGSRAAGRTSVGLPLTGRKAQLDWTESRLQAGGSVLITGDPGIGKTRLMAEALGRAAAGGRTVGRVAVAGSSISLPLAPLAHLLPPDIDPRDEFAALQQAIDALRAAGADQPLLIGLDDAHLLDDLSTLVLHQAVIADAAQVIATARSEHALPAGIDGIWRSDRGARLDLLPLDPHAVGLLIEAALEGPVEGATTALIDEASGGSPLAVIELVNHGRASGRLQQRSGLWSWSGDIGSNLRLEELLGLSLDDLEPASRELLELVALGEPLPVTIVEALAAPEVIADVDRHGFLADGARVGTVRPNHPLVAEQLVGDLGVLRRRQLLSRLVTAFATADEAPTPARGSKPGLIRPSLVEDDRIRVALWSLECGRDIAIDELLHAAESARYRQAAAESERLARVAFDRAPSFETGLLLGRALHGSGRYEEADQTFAAIADQVASDQELADYVSSRSLTLRFGLDRSEDASALVEDARPRITDVDLSWALVQIEARALFHRGELRRVLELWDEATASDAPEGARYDLAEWACGAYSLMGRASEVTQLMAWVGEAASRHGSTSPRVAQLVQFYWAMEIATVGDIAAIAPLAQAFYDSAVHDDNAVVRAYGAMVLQFIATFRGDLVLAERLAREATFVPPTSQAVRLSALCALARILVLQGRPADAAGILAEIDGEERTIATTHRYVKETVRALIAFRAGHEQDGAAELRAAADAAAAAGHNLAAVQAAFDLIGLGHSAHVVDLLQQVSTVIEGPFAQCVTALANAAAAKDVEGLAAVADQAEAGELRHVAITALSQAAAAERAAGRNGAAARFLEQSDVLAAQCPGLALPPERVELGLSPREREVAQLAARQLSDKAIAEQLFLSVRTVNAHLRSIYTKLGISSRAELADVPGLLTDAAPTGAPR